MTGPAIRKNPYIGPRAFQPGEKLFGRDYEIHELLNLLIAERIVLLHAPSGAGKSSIIQAGVLPHMQADDFVVLPVIRVNLQPPPEISSQDGFNRYVYSTLVSLEERLPPNERRKPEDLACMSLAEYLPQVTAAQPRRMSGEDTELLEQHVKRSALNLVLVFDQFEEILTVDPNDQPGKMSFFNQLGEALRNRSIWALFAMREDYLPALSPFLRPVPTHLNVTYRLDFLDVKGTSDAIRKPAQLAGSEFTEAAAEMLIDDLRRVKVQQPNGEFRDELGLFVEPLQLQVVCNRLWDHLEKNDAHIDEADVRSLGNVSVSLSEYYNQRVAEIVQKTAISERSIRAWFQEHLITPGGTRSQVMLEQEKTKGLDNNAIFTLVNAHLVRAEKRGGATWFELAHDRLIGPVRESNQAWFEEHLSLLQKQAALWNKQGQPEGMLLRGKELAEASDWASRHESTLEPYERRFLQFCHNAIQREIEVQNLREKELLLEGERERARLEAERAETERRRAEAEKSRADDRAAAVKRVSRLNRALGGLVAVALLIMAFAMYQLYRSTQETERANLEATRANASGLLLVKEKHTAVAALSKANAALGTASAANTESTAASELTELRMRELTQQAYVSGNLVSTQQSALIAAQQMQVATRPAPYETPTGQPPEAEDRSRELAQEAIQNAAQPDLALLLAVEAGQARNTTEARGALLSSLQQALQESNQILGMVLRDSAGSISSMSFSPDGKMLTASAEGSLRQWNAGASLETNQPAASQISAGFVDGVFYNPTGSLVAIVNPKKSLLVQDRVPQQAEGMDVSHWDGKIDWERVKDRISFAYAKSTEANYYLDDTFADNWFAMKQAGILRGNYHVFNYEVDPIKQAAYYLKAVSQEPGDLPPALDLTAINNKNRTLGPDAVNNVRAWLEYVEAETGLQPVMIIANFLISQYPEMSQFLQDPAFERFPLWIQYYRETDPQLDFLGRRWTFWQYSDKGRLPGINGVNLDRFNGSLENLRGLAYSAYAAIVQEAASGKLLLASQRPFDEVMTNNSGTFLAIREGNAVRLVDTITFRDIFVAETPGRLLGVNAAHQYILLAEQNNLNILSFDNTIATIQLRAPVAAVASSGSLLAVGDQSGLIQVFSYENRESPLAQWSRAANSIASLAISQNGSILIIGDVDGTINLWDLESQQQIGAPLQGHSGAVIHLVLSPQEGIIASGGLDGRVILWDFREETLNTRACAAAGRNLSLYEWEQFMPGEAYQPACP